MHWTTKRLFMAVLLMALPFSDLLPTAPAPVGFVGEAAAIIGAPLTPFSYAGCRPAHHPARGGGERHVGRSRVAHRRRERLFGARPAAAYGYGRSTGQFSACRSTSAREHLEGLAGGAASRVPKAASNTTTAVASTTGRPSRETTLSTWCRAPENRRFRHRRARGDVFPLSPAGSAAAARR